ncbi:MAG: HNH endonuclease family protein [Candidatus Saccharibacteria bacterium]
MGITHQKRRTVIVGLLLAFFSLVVFINIPKPTQPVSDPEPKTNTAVVTSPATETLKTLVIKERGSNEDYVRDKFGSDWTSVSGCDTRNIILNRDLLSVVVGDKCTVISGLLNDPYTGKLINFVRGKDTSGDVQIDHVVALSNAWQTGAQQFTPAERIKLANDPLELLAVDGKANMEKSDGDAAAWLPPNKPFRCQYIARQIAIKHKYSLWVDQPEYDAISKVLQDCPGQMLPSP